jgi:ribosomal protein S18 acetylase RimI-like enzyme
MSAIRRARLADVADLARVHVACWHESYDGLVPAATLAAFTVERGKAVWGRILGEPDAFNAAAAYVVEIDHRLVGFGSCCAQRSPELAARGYDGEVSSIYLLRAVQRHGQGASLLHALAADLLGRGFAAASLWVLRDNARARGFYERCGGRILAERVDVREHTELFEVAYGWSSLAALRDACGMAGGPAPKTHPMPGSGA